MSKNQFKKIQDQQDKEYKEMLERIVPIAKKALKIITEGDVLIGQNKDNSGKPVKEFYEFYKERSTKVLELLRDNNLKYNDIETLVQFMVQPVDLFRNYITTSLKQSFEKAQAILWGKDHLDVTLQDLDKILKERG